ncbi:DUF5689 domain-containing protein [Flavobacterium sp. UMI-01]|uniref:DUF5689 domain-containing protein n=1 Tax=Flavobacterium sp. UMI-01 TaxID=1441053 RepID=UPI001C7DC5B7|nr:DUF5689 domain-containing protein [Flavobacterium sp. UMI-01]GIZ07875.1 hypothetical protein FUMI01_06020 [Flavobacterium sp. UMI-01]
MKTFLPFVIGLLFVFSSCVSDTPPVPELVCNQLDLTPNQTVATVLEKATSVVTQYGYDDILEAYVVSSDEYGNFFKTLYLQTMPTASIPAIGFSVPVDASNLYVDYRLGNKVYLKLKNQYTDIYYGGLRIGAIYANAFNEASVGRLSQNDYKRVLYPSCTTLPEEQLVRTTTIPELTKDNNLNTLVELNEVQFAEAAIGRRYFEESNNVGGGTNWYLTDKNGNQIYLRTSSYARFANNLVPTTKVKIRGVLTKFGADYQLVVRSEKDIEPTTARGIPFFTENFQSVTDKSNLSLPGWTNLTQAGSLFWKGAVYNGNGCAEFAISGTKVNSNIAWLISPKIDMDSYKNEVLTFRTAQHHLDVDSPLNTLEVYVSTNFDGLDVTKANWTKVTFNVPQQATPWYQFIGSGGVDLSHYTGKINIAFKYIGSGKNTALDGAFQVDDVQIFGEK